MNNIELTQRVLLRVIRDSKGCIVTNKQPRKLGGSIMGKYSVSHVELPDGLYRDLMHVCETENKSVVVLAHDGVTPTIATRDDGRLVYRLTFVAAK